jgi:hypothetical protein
MNKKSLLKHTVERLEKRGDRLLNVRVFKELKNQLENALQMDTQDTSNQRARQVYIHEYTYIYLSICSPNARRDGWKSATIDEHEEAYFSAADDEDDEDGDVLIDEKTLDVHMSPELSETLDRMVRKKRTRSDADGADEPPLQRRRSILDDDDDDEDDEDEPMHPASSSPAFGNGTSHHDTSTDEADSSKRTLRRSTPSPEANKT